MPESFAKDIATIARIDAVRQILEVVCRTTGLGFSAVARVTESRWIACAVRDEIDFGLEPGGELQVGTTICNEIRQSGEIVVIDHVAQDEAFCIHPTPLMYGFQSYISVPITLPDGRFFGTLCAIDPRPARLQTPEIIGMFKLFADLIGQHLDAQERMAITEAALLTERETSKLRDQFIAVLGHDLRNPLAAIGAAAAVLRSSPEGTDNTDVLDLIQRSTARMGDLIGDILDFARGRLGSGLDMTRLPDAKLAAALEQVVTEIQATWPGRTINRDFAIDAPVYCDSARLAQMLSNLLANAITHGDSDSPISVAARTTETDFEMSVSNCGKTIAPEVREQLFQPFSRGTARPGQAGLGLGLYISAQIARAHGGTLEVESEDGLTCFTFKMPLQQPVEIVAV
jgi:signal transduction histidine kinase